MEKEIYWKAHINVIWPNINDFQQTRFEYILINQVCQICIKKVFDASALTSAEITRRVEIWDIAQCRDGLRPMRSFRVMESPMRSYYRSSLTP